jgi:pimeloyl-ACP methyl ester carboxylesterase
LALLLATAVALTLWVQAVRLYYRPRERRLTPLRATCADGWEIAVYHREPARPRFEEPVLLCHGLAANHYNFDFQPPYSVAHYLAEAGFHCFTVDFRGAGASQRPPPGRRRAYCADDQIDFDAPALVRLALERTGAREAFWVGHSLGGLVGLASAQREVVGKLRGLITLGAPVFIGPDPVVKLAVRLGSTLAWPYAFRHQIFSTTVAPFLGYVSLPFTEMVINPRHIAARVQRQVYAQLMSSVSRKAMLQLKDWVFNDAFRSFDRTRDYRPGIARLTMPMLVIGGGADRLAPAAQVRAAYELAGSSDKTLAIFGRDTGCAQDYGHADLIFGQGAPEEVYPLIRKWLIAHASGREANS